MERFNFTFAEMCASEKAEAMGIPNIPAGNEFIYMGRLVVNVLQPARDWLKSPIRINSGYRCKELNKEVGGVANSQHMKGQAVDITTGTRTGNIRLFDWMRDNVPYDQIILEKDGQWIHVSCVSFDENRKQVLYM